MNLSFVPVLADGLSGRVKTPSKHKRERASFTRSDETLAANDSNVNQTKTYD
jgi:hypothetical protein